MKTYMANNILSQKAVLIAVAAFAALLFVATNLPWELDDYDQAQQAFTSFEMIKEGHWFYQRTPHELIAQKPPLVGWVSAALFPLTRSWNVAWRLPSLLAACATAIALYRAAASAYGPIPGLVAFSAFTLNLLTTRLATLVRTDMPLALSIALLGLIIFKKIHNQQKWTDADRWLLFAILTVSLWIKGPFAYLFVLPAVILFQWRYKRSQTVGAWSGWWPWVLPFVVFLCWIVGGILVRPGFYEEVVAFEFIGRLSPTVHRAQPVYFYLGHLLHKFAPWSVLMIALAVITTRQTKQRIRSVLSNLTPEMFWLIVWSLSGLVIMSLVPSKRVDRVFALVPALSLLLSAQVAHCLSNPDLRPRVYRWTVLALVCAVMFSGAYTAFKVTTGYRGHKDALERFSSAVEKEARTYHWRYEIVRDHSAGTEGMLLYLQRLHFIDADDAVEVWNSGQVDALVVPYKEIPDLVSKLKNAQVSPFQSFRHNKQSDPGYALILRSVEQSSRGFNG